MAMRKLLSHKEFHKNPDPEFWYPLVAVISLPFEFRDHVLELVNKHDCDFSLLRVWMIHALNIFESLNNFSNVDENRFGIKLTSLRNLLIIHMGFTLEEANEYITSLGDINRLPYDVLMECRRCPEFEIDGYKISFGIYNSDIRRISIPVRIIKDGYIYWDNLRYQNFGCMFMKFKLHKKWAEDSLTE